MSTYMPKANEISRKWYVLDASGKSLGRVAAQAAAILRGKHKPTFAPHEQKTYKWHTGWIGGLKETKYSEMMKKNPEKAMMIAVNGMLPNNTLGRAALTRLRVYAGAEHNHAAQKPEKFDI